MSRIIYRRIGVTVETASKGDADRNDVIWASTLESARRMASGGDQRVERDEGTCVTGAGIAVEYLPPRSRYPRTLIIVRSYRWQGNIAQYKACEVTLKWLQEIGIDCYWHDGTMD